MTIGEKVKVRFGQDDWRVGTIRSIIATWTDGSRLTEPVYLVAVDRKIVRRLAGELHQPAK